jgi:ribose-phosphate pyrophosphokinase
MVELKIDGVTTDFKQWNFPAGEVGVQIPQISEQNKVQVWMRMPSSDDIFVCLNILDALFRQEVNPKNIELHIPYLPYGRQDRVCTQGESFALQVFANTLVANAWFSKLVMYDAHSSASWNVFSKYLFEVENKSQADCAKYLPRFDALVAPDKGASTKVNTHFQVRGFDTKVFTLNKVRQDGRVIYEDYAYDTISGKVCVVDDICDGGATFLSLAEMLWRTQPNIKSLNLYVTHGIFSKGVAELLKFYDTIYVHNLMNDMVQKAQSVAVI